MTLPCPYLLATFLFGHTSIEGHQEGDRATLRAQATDTNAREQMRLARLVLYELPRNLRTLAFQAKRIVCSEVES